MLTLQDNILFNNDNGVKTPVEYIFSYRLEYRHGDNGAIISQETIALSTEIEHCPPGFIVTANNYALPLSEMFESRWWDQSGHTYFYPNDLSVKVGGICLPDGKDRLVEHLNNTFRVAMAARLEKLREIERGILSALSLTTKIKESKSPNAHNHH